MFFRRSLYLVQDMKAGAVLARENVCSIRPGFGFPPTCLGQVLGVKVIRDVKRGTVLQWELLP